MQDDSAPADDEQPTTRTARQARTRQTLLDSALEVFVTRGFHGASVDEIARHAGYTKGAVYANFDSKDDLFLAVVDRRIAQGAKIHEAEARGEELSEEDLRTFIEGQFQIRWALLAFEAILYAVRERPDLMTELAERYQQIDAVGTRALEEKLADPPERTDLVAIAQQALHEGLMIRHLIEPERINHEVIEQIYEVVFDSEHQRAWQEF